MNPYECWLAKKKNANSKMNSLPYEDHASELRENYSRQIEIFDEILQEASYCLDDEQYCETTSWKYEYELTKLYYNQIKLEEKFETEHSIFEHQSLLKDLGWTQEQFDSHMESLKEEEEHKETKMKDKYIPKGLLESDKHLSEDTNVFLKLVDQKSDKFWAAFEDDGKYLIVWGKNDKTPYQSQRIFKIEAETRLKEKIRKGYVFSPGNPLLYYFQNNPNWFSKLDTSELFKKSILAYKMDNKLDDQPKETRKAFKI